MKFQTFSDSLAQKLPICFLVPELDGGLMEKEYLKCDGITPIDPSEVIAYELYKTGKKTSAATQKEFLDELFEILLDLGVTYLCVGDAEYYKTITGAAKADANAGYVVPSAYPKDRPGLFNVVYVPNFRQVFHNPAPTRSKIALGLGAMQDHQKGAYEDPGRSIVKVQEEPQTVAEIQAALMRVIDLDLAIDIEAFSLRHYKAGIGTIALAWNKHEGMVFPVDYVAYAEPIKGDDGKLHYGKQVRNEPLRRVLRDFFKAYVRKQIYHNCAYDIMVLIYELFMNDLLDTAGLLEGLEVMTANFDDTKLITYLATNSCAGNKLSLKDQAQEFAGNYAQDEIKDIRLIPLPELLRYNLVDACATWYVREKWYDRMVADEQEEVYEGLFKGATVDIIQMQLTGMALDMDVVAQTRLLLGIERDNALDRIHSHPAVLHYNALLNQRAVKEYNETRKVKRITLADVDEKFNPNSSPQMAELLYEVLELPVMSRTKEKAPSTKAKEIAKLKAYTEDQDAIDLINALGDFAAVDKIYGTFIPAMEEAVKARDGAHYLFGFFNLGGTVSGRLSSSKPNLQNLPANSKYAKLIKACFKAPKGYLMIGLDFASLEDRISALTTKDPNKLKVYTDGYDGHSLRAYSYFGEQMPDIDPNSVESINSIEKLYKPLRQDSKMPTFLLTYDGTWIGMVAQGNFSPAQAQEIEKRYHELYRHSDEWKAAKIQEASKRGYITAAFGLRVRTPLLSQVILGNRATPWEAQAEARTAGNALGQSWCLLNSRASVEFMKKVRASKYRLLIRPIAHIHDAQYYLIPDDIEVLGWVNKHLVKAVEWQDHPDIAHDKVKLGGEVSVFWPSWAQELTIPNGMRAKDMPGHIRNLLEEIERKKQEKKAA